VWMPVSALLLSCVLAVLFACLLLGFWTLFGAGILRLPLYLAPRLTAAYRLRRFLRSGKKVRVAGFGDPEAGEEPGFYLVFDGTPRQDSRLTALLFSEIEPRSLAENAAAFQRIQGRTAEAYCYLNSLTGVQLTGTLEAGDDGLRLLVRRIRLSGRKKEIFLK
jgi:hypothetical protein